jgi:pyruvate/2-oxoacid:ferredoxin oxidoreductase alpha subunit
LLTNPLRRNVQDGFLTTHTVETVRLPEPEFMKEYIGSPKEKLTNLMDPTNPLMSGVVQNQDSYMKGKIAQRWYYDQIPEKLQESFDEFARKTGRRYGNVEAYRCEDADYVVIGLGSITDDVRAVQPYLRSIGLKVGVISVKLLQPFPEAELVAAIGKARAITVLERSDDTALTRLVNQALLHARANAEASKTQQPYPDVPAIAAIPRLTTAIFGLGGHDVQPRHLVAAGCPGNRPCGGSIRFRLKERIVLRRHNDGDKRLAAVGPITTGAHQQNRRAQDEQYATDARHQWPSSAAERSRYGISLACKRDCI